MTLGTPAPDDIFTDGQQWGDVDAWNRAALDPADEGKAKLEGARQVAHQAAEELLAGLCRDPGCGVAEHGPEPARL